MSGDGGITLEEYAPFGVIGAILPVTHSVPTLTGNVINMVAAGNSIVFNPHPGGARSAAMAVRAYNEAIFREIGIDNLITTIEQPTLESFDAICKNPLIPLLAITGGPAVVNAAMKSGKRAICAGPGNPVVVVDETADLARPPATSSRAAPSTTTCSASARRSCSSSASVFNRFCEELTKAGAARINAQQLEKLTAAAFTIKPGEGGGCAHASVNRALVGADPSKLARARRCHHPGRHPAALRRDGCRPSLRAGGADDADDADRFVPGLRNRRPRGQARRAQLPPLRHHPHAGRRIT